MPDTKLFIDFETRSFADLKKCGAWVYSEHESTDIICLGYTLEGDKPKIWVPGNDIPPEFTRYISQVVAHNALFDFAIAVNILVKKYGFPLYLLNYTLWYCTQALSTAAGLAASLDKAGKFFNLKKLGEGKTLINKYSKPMRRKDSVEFREMTTTDRDLMYKYCKQDVIICRILYNNLIDLPNSKLERDVFLFDFKQNLDGLPIDHTSLHDVLTTLSQATENAESEMLRIGLNVRSAKQVIEWMAEKGIEINNTQAGTIEVIKNTTLDPEVLKVCELRSFLSKASLKKYAAIRDRICADGTLKYFLRYYGAHTGRASGQGFQPHNLPKTGTTERDIKEAIKTVNADLSDYPGIVKKCQVALPGMIKADPGKTFLIGDFASIEARGIAYISGEKALLNQFAGDKDVYKEMAAVIYNKHVLQIDDKERALGKAVILGCGYGMGIDTFFTTCKNWGVDITGALAERAVKTYRNTYTAIPNFWYALSGAFRTVYQTKKPLSLMGGLKVERLKNYLRVELPGGRFLYYHEFKIEGQEIYYYNQTKEWYVKLWGGIIAENVIQAMCRDILIDRMLACDKAGLKPILHVHDEIICHIDKKDEKGMSKVFNKIMNTPPEWLPNFPLKTEIEVSGRYHK